MTSYSLKNKHRSAEKKKRSPKPRGSTGPPIPLRKNGCSTAESNMTAMLETERKEASKQSDQPSSNIDWLTIFIITPNLTH